jgi:hypothetical protein
VSLVVAFLLCSGVFLLPFSAGGAGMSSGLDMASLQRVDQASNGNGYLPDGTYLVGPVEEVKDAEKQPLNTGLLTMLLLTISFGATVGWLLRNAQRQEALCSLAVGRPSAATCEDLPLLAVFRL